MTCKETEKYIAKFIDKNMPEEDMEAFISHVESCPACKEELTIQYLVTVGMNRLEAGGTFDLRGELDNRLTQTMNKIRFRKKVNAAYFAGEVVFISAVFFITLFFLY